MSQRIATPAAVFAVCDRLSASEVGWNRDDVRLAVGGGGFNVIDPLIQAWRKLQPVKALAPATPTELLYLLAQALDTHLAAYLSEAERREREREAVFNATAETLSGKMEELERQLALRAHDNAALQEDCDTLQKRLAAKTQQLKEKEQQAQKLQAMNDHLNGQMSRLQQEKMQLAEQHNEATNHLTTAHRQQISELIDEHKTELAKQKREFMVSNEKNETHLMRLFDRERTDLKKERDKMEKLLTDLRNKEQALREQSIQSAMREAAYNEKNNQLTAALETAQHSLIEHQQRVTELEQELLQERENRASEDVLTQMQVSLQALQRAILAPSQTPPAEAP